MMYLNDLQKSPNLSLGIEYFIVILDTNTITMAKNNRDRYFIVTYLGLTEGNSTYGSCSITVEDGGYINRDRTIKNIVESTEKHQWKTIKDVILTNIIELTEADFLDYNAK